MLDLSQFKAEINNRFGRPFSLIFERIESAINQIGTLTGVDPLGHTQTPDAPQGINVASGSDHIHVTLNDSSQRTRARNYFLEWATEPNFLQPNVEHLGASRGRIFAMPSKTGAGATISYYFRAYSMDLGAQNASRKIYFGTNLAPTAVNLTGSSTLNLLPSTGSGTAAPQQGGQGFGTSQFAKAVA
jgi:hypothetical protein